MERMNTLQKKILLYRRLLSAEEKTEVTKLLKGIMSLLSPHYLLFLSAFAASMISHAIWASVSSELSSAVISISV